MSSMNYLNYWRLYCRIFLIPICRKCDKSLDKAFQERKQGYLCKSCLGGQMNNECVHHWIIDSENYGVCNKCHIEKQFPIRKKQKFIPYSFLGEGRQRHWRRFSGEDNNPSQDNAIKILEDLQ